MRALASPRDTNAPAGQDEPIALAGLGAEPAGIAMMSGFGSDFGSDFGGLDGDGDAPLLDAGTTPRARLERLVDFDETRAAAVLREWLHQAKAA